MDKEYSKQGCSVMSLMERTIRGLAGFLVILTLSLGYFVNPYWFLGTLFVGLNLLQSAFTRWCLAEDILGKAGVKRK